MATTDEQGISSDFTPKMDTDPGQTRLDVDSMQDSNQALRSCAAAAGLGMYWSGLDYTSANALAAASMAAMTGHSAMTSMPQTQVSQHSSPESTNSNVSSLAVPMAYPSSNTGYPSVISRQFAHSTTPTPKKKATAVPTHLKDPAYWDRRKKNNESARRSREARRMKEEQIHMRVVYLEQENLQLRTERQLLQLQIERLNMSVYGTAATQRLG